MPRPARRRRRVCRGKRQRCGQVRGNWADSPRRAPRRSPRNGAVMAPARVPSPARRQPGGACSTSPCLPKYATLRTGGARSELAPAARVLPRRPARRRRRVFLAPRRRRVCRVPRAPRGAQASGACHGSSDFLAPPWHAGGACAASRVPRDSGTSPAGRAPRVPQCSRTPHGAGCACAAPPWQWRALAARHCSAWQ